MIILITRYFLSPWYIKLIIFYTMALAININLSTAYCAADTIDNNTTPNTQTDITNPTFEDQFYGVCFFIMSISLILMVQHGDLHFIQTFIENHCNNGADIYDPILQDMQDQKNELHQHLMEKNGTISRLLEEARINQSQVIRPHEWPIDTIQSASESKSDSSVDLSAINSSLENENNSLKQEVASLREANKNLLSGANNMSKKVIRFEREKVELTNNWQKSLHQFTDVANKYNSLRTRTEEILNENTALRAEKSELLANNEQLQRITEIMHQEAKSASEKATNLFITKKELVMAQEKIQRLEARYNDSRGRLTEVANERSAAQLSLTETQLELAAAQNKINRSIEVFFSEEPKLSRVKPKTILDFNNEIIFAKQLHEYPRTGMPELPELITPRPASAGTTREMQSIIMRVHGSTSHAVGDHFFNEYTYLQWKLQNAEHARDLMYRTLTSGNNKK